MDLQPMEADALYSWLSRLQSFFSKEGELAGSNVDIKGNYVTVRCPNKYLVEDVIDLCPSLKLIGYGLRIIVGRELVEDFPPHKPTGPTTMIQTLDLQSVQNEWLKDLGHANIVRFLMEKGTVALHSTDSDRGYECEAIFPFLGNAQVLSKPPSELIGKPVEASTGIIAAKKRAAIEKAIASKGNSEELYDYRWGAAPSTEWMWDMRCSGIWVSEKHVLTCSENMKDWQRQYWIDLLRAS